MSNWKDILAKERKPGDTWADAMKKKFEKALYDLEHLNEQILERAQQTEASYRKKIAEGTRLGLQRAKKRGVKLGGHRTSKIDRKRLRGLVRRGFKQMQIAENLGCSQALVSRLLKKEKTRRKKK
jgi:DNA invertase Pin-like site-specific DNA recombinase